MLLHRLWLEIYKPKSLHTFLAQLHQKSHVSPKPVRTYIDKSKDSTQTVLTWASAFLMTKSECTIICSCSSLIPCPTQTSWCMKMSSTPSSQGSIQIRQHYQNTVLGWHPNLHQERSGLSLQTHPNFLFYLSGLKMLIFHCKLTMSSVGLFGLCWFNFAEMKRKKKKKNQTSPPILFTDIQSRWVTKKISPQQYFLCVSGLPIHNQWTF